ncbi:hypothetical protein [Spirosoma aerolatum]|uniref:hypothetical protein n=1 Tax=Spirosoma aerolatum TaxID=1211326 RepID=UPI0009AE2428|nr:hypothetical protein [Spirosoma aerolatum]
MRIRINKVLALPDLPDPNTIYLVKSGDFAKGYITSDAGEPIPIMDEDIIAQLIQDAQLGETNLENYYTKTQVNSLLTSYVLLTTLQAGYSTTSQMNAAIQSAINTLIGGAPGLLDTFNEIAAALGNDPNFATTVTTLLSGKQDKETGKGLSQENFTTTLLNKLNGIQSGATANDLTPYSTTSQVNTLISTAINNLVNSAPGTLDTLKELADALGDDPNFAATITAALTGKVDKVTGKGLSTEDFTTALLNKLNGIASNATAVTSTDSLTEGGTNKYFTETRVRSTLLTGLVAAVSRVLPVDTDSLLTAWGKVVKFLTDLKTVAFTGAYSDLTGTPTFKTINSNSITGTGDIAITGNPVTTTTNSSASGSISWAWSTAINVFNVTTSGNCTFANPTGLSFGQQGILLVTIGGAGHTLSFGTNWKWPNSTTPTFPTASGSVIEIRLFSDGTNVYAEWSNPSRLNPGTVASESDALITARKNSNANANDFEWGHPTTGYLATLGHESTTGNPFLAFFAQAGTGNATFRTRGLKGVVVKPTTSGDLTFNSIASANADNQAATEWGRFAVSGELMINTTTNNTRDKLQVNGSMSFNFASGSADPTTTDLPSGKSILWKNTTSGTIKWYCNDGGTIKSSVAFS